MVAKIPEQIRVSTDTYQRIIKARGMHEMRTGVHLSIGDTVDLALDALEESPDFLEAPHDRAPA